MTPDELARLSRGLDELPAGAGALEVIGVVFLVLLLLELVGVIDIFKKRILTQVFIELVFSHCLSSIGHAKSSNPFDRNSIYGRQPPRRT